MKNRRILPYLLIAFVWTWTGWISGYLLGRARGFDMGADGTLFTLFSQDMPSDRFLPQLLLALAVYGPLIGFLAMGGLKGIKSFRTTASNSGPFWLLAVLVPVGIVLPTSILSLAMGLFDTDGRTGGAILAAIGLYFLSNFVTSGTEEFGWRGFLYPAMKAGGASFWDIAWKGGLIWAVWHFPLMVRMYLPMGIAVLIPSLVGFCASIVAMNYIANLVYERTGSLVAAMLLHALNNTASFAVTLLFPGTPVTILIHLSIWVVVWILDKRGAVKLPISAPAGSAPSDTAVPSDTTANGGSREA